MRKIRVNLKKRSYDIIVGSNILKDAGRHILTLNLGRDAYIITNSLIKNKYGRALEKSLRQNCCSVRFKVVADTEKSKSFQTMSAVLKDIASCDRKKKIFIIALGGGVIGDLSGFVASVYKRGTPYVQIPTTLLAQVDSAIGGKTAIDLEEGKNLVGAFYQPRLVISDISLLKTLDARQLRSGLAEVIKYAAIKDAGLFNYLERKYRDILSAKEGALEFVVSRCSQIKAKIVERDEKEKKGIRTILNFGHTLAHAIEAAGKFKAYNHGEAVALGMLVASGISRELGLMDNGVSLRLENLIRAAGLPTGIKGVSLPKIIQAHYRDKKFSGAKNRLVLLEGLGRVKIAENVPLEIIEKSLKERILP